MDMSWWKWEPFLNLAGMDGGGEGNGCGVSEGGAFMVVIGSKYGVVSNLRLQLGSKILQRTLPAQ